MKRNILILIASTSVYALTFRVASLLFEQYIIHINGPVLPVVLFEQSLIPFAFGFFVYKILNVKGAFSPLIVLVMPVTVLSISTIVDIIKGENVTIFEYTSLYLIVITFLILFVVLGAYVQYWKKSNVYS